MTLDVALDVASAKLGLTCTLLVLLGFSTHQLSQGLHSEVQHIQISICVSEAAAQHCVLASDSANALLLA